MNNETLVKYGIASKFKTETRCGYRSAIDLSQFRYVHNGRTLLVPNPSSDDILTKCEAMVKGEGLKYIKGKDFISVKIY